MAIKTSGKVCLLCTALTLPLSVQGASGDDSRNPVPPAPFSVHDTDGDGYLSREEYAVFYQAFEERHRAAGRPAHRMLEILSFERIDSDGDGLISVDEMVSALRKRRQGPGWRWRQSIY